MKGAQKLKKFDVYDLFVQHIIIVDTSGHKQYTVVATNSTHVTHEVLAGAVSEGLPGTLLPSGLLHTVASCDLLAQLVLLYMKGAQKLKKIVYDLFLQPNNPAKY